VVVAVVVRQVLVVLTQAELAEMEQHHLLLELP
jgi:hypothetical protein